MDSKRWYESKTLWTNFGAIILVAAQAAQGAPWCDPSIQAVVIAVANAILRLTTDKAVTK